MVPGKRGFVLLASLLAAPLSLMTSCVGGDETSADTCMSDGHGGESDDGSDDGESDDSDGDGDSGNGNDPPGCAGHGSVEACMDQPGCAPVFGHALVDDGDQGWCSDPTQLYLGCVSTLSMCPFPDVECDPCPGGDRILCDGDGYWLANGCVPDDFEPCAAPGPLSGSC